MTVLVQVAAVALAALAAATVLGHIANPPRPRKTRPVTTLRRILDRLARTATDDPQRSPDWCHTHNCHRSACPQH